MIRRGTTPTHVFTVDVDLTQATALYITYKQSDRIVIEKTLADCTITATTVTVELTQAESLKFAITSPVEIQIRAKFEDGTAIASNIMEADVGRILKGGEI